MCLLRAGTYSSPRIFARTCFEGGMNSIWSVFGQSHFLHSQTEGAIADQLEELEVGKK